MQPTLIVYHIKYLSFCKYLCTQFKCIIQHIQVLIARLIVRRMGKITQFSEKILRNALFNIPQIYGKSSPCLTSLNPSRLLCLSLRYLTHLLVACAGTHQILVIYFVLTIHHTLVTQPMMQRRPNQTELRSMDSYTQILCRFQKSKQKVPPPSPLTSEK